MVGEDQHGGCSVGKVEENGKERKGSEQSERRLHLHMNYFVHEIHQKTQIRKLKGSISITWKR